QFRRTRGQIRFDAQTSRGKLICRKWHEPGAGMSLVEWQTRLGSHFTQLRLDRTRVVGDQPLFALEHGLSENEIADLSTSLRQQVAIDDPSGKHWLAWIVYAAEMGYRYEGDEYWQTFERHTPGWRFGYRSIIRAWFVRFHNEFTG